MATLRLTCLPPCPEVRPWVPWSAWPRNPCPTCHSTVSRGCRRDPGNKHSTFSELSRLGCPASRCQTLLLMLMKARLSVKKCGEKFFAPLLPSFLRPILLMEENGHTICPVPQSAPHVSVRMNVLDYSKGPRRKATDVCPVDGVCSRGGLLRRKGNIRH